MTIEAMKLALEALDGMAKDGWLLHGPEGMDTAQTKCVEAIAALRAAIEQAEKKNLDNRTLIRMRQAAWRNVRAGHKQDPELCFALGFDAGYDAVALRVEPPAAESGAGFESLPASPIAPAEKQEPVAWLITEHHINELQIESIQRLIDRSRHAHMTDIKLRINGEDEWYQADWLKHLTRTAPPQREWQGLTDKEYEQLAEQHVTNCYFDTLTYAKAIEAKLKGKNA